MLFASSGPISVKNLLKCSAMLFKFFISLFPMQIFLGKFCCWIVSFPRVPLITDHVFLILSLYLTIFWTFFYCLKQSLIVFAFIFIFCHFLFLETSHTVGVYVSKVFLSQLLSSDFQYLCFELLSFSFEKRHHKYKEI